MGTAILGRIGLVIESSTNPGEYPVVAPWAVSALPVTPNPQPNAVGGSSIYVGARLFIVVTGNITTGTISIAGKDFSQAQNAITEVTPTIPVAGSASNPTGVYEYVTTNVFSTVNSGGITAGGAGLTGGTVKVYAIQGARSLQPCMMDVEEKIPRHSPQEQRGLVSRHTAQIPLNKVVDIGKLDMILLPDTAAWWFGRCVVGNNPTAVTIPAAGSLTAIHAAASPPYSTAFTQPNTVGPDELLQIVIASSTAVGTVTLTGTNRYGQVINETVQCGVPGAANGNGTWYTQQAFATVTNVTATGLTSGTVALNGYILLQETYNAAPGNDSLGTVTLEWYTGTDAVSIPFGYFTEVTLEGSPEKEIKLSAKGGAQDMLTIGDRTTTPMTATTRATQIGAPGSFSSTGGGTAGGLWQNFDVGLSGWMSAWYIDPISGTPGTTAYNSVVDWKLLLKTPQKPFYPSYNWQRFSKLYREQRETEGELTIAFDDVVQYEQFRQNAKQIFQLQLIGPPAGVVSSVTYSKNWTFNFAAKIIEMKRDASKMEKVEAKCKFIAEYTTNVGGAGTNYEYQFIQQVALPANYAS